MITIINAEGCEPRTKSVEGCNIGTHIAANDNLSDEAQLLLAYIDWEGEDEDFLEKHGPDVEIHYEDPTQCVVCAGCGDAVPCTKTPAGMLCDECREDQW